MVFCVDTLHVVVFGAEAVGQRDCCVVRPIIFKHISSQMG